MSVKDSTMKVAPLSMMDRLALAIGRKIDVSGSQAQNRKSKMEAWRTLEKLLEKNKSFEPPKLSSKTVTTLKNNLSADNIYVSNVDVGSGVWKVGEDVYLTGNYLDEWSKQKENEIEMSMYTRKGQHTIQRSNGRVVILHLYGEAHKHLPTPNQRNLLDTEYLRNISAVHQLANAPSPPTASSTVSTSPASASTPSNAAITATATTTAIATTATATTTTTTITTTTTTTSTTSTVASTAETTTTHSPNAVSSRASTATNVTTVDPPAIARTNTIDTETMCHLCNTSSFDEAVVRLRAANNVNKMNPEHQANQENQARLLRSRDSTTVDAAIAAQTNMQEATLGNNSYTTGTTCSGGTSATAQHQPTDIRSSRDNSRVDRGFAANRTTSNLPNAPIYPAAHIAEDIEARLDRMLRIPAPCPNKWSEPLLSNSNRSATYSTAPGTTNTTTTEDNHNEEDTATVAYTTNVRKRRECGNRDYSAVDEIFSQNKKQKNNTMSDPQQRQAHTQPQLSPTTRELSTDTTTAPSLSPTPIPPVLLSVQARLASPEVMPTQQPTKLPTELPPLLQHHLPFSAPQHIPLTQPAQPTPSMPSLHPLLPLPLLPPLPPLPTLPPSEIVYEYDPTTLMPRVIYKY